ncbi:NifB/NifX family molybdenum-iron cluster-binding protein [Pectobacteriaceae bacterium CE70]|uniref:Nitrogen fixation protein NifY n=1 Tax=Serratia sp. (strain ATCC 39006) TaxID=104623 RepID=A0A2I5TQA4_SERS3|nr:MULTISPECIES: NifB/NifX family molybdenum-iron cluster-binding protein [Enterobacterales]AUH02415.1 nitrogen fixation protein NifY [Serratia sp. ATCC 39006]AUH06735.1 nitrogen fixation protein NifY [Serratia sp. ATCC 39006]WJV69114.1 NifB/NifX family molybdenum-iron cluster-binding protein [Pectobacteriaceae bacterium CE70]WJY13054.1 NifB/NifX family molybdenum-iron cluster-binding protein [Pectobacteriaceae bacterium C80]
MSKDDILFWRLFALIQYMPELTPAQLLNWLCQESDAGLDLEQLQSLSLGELEARFPGDVSIMTLNRWQQVMNCLNGELPEHLSVEPRHLMSNHLLVAFASQDGLTINGHFGQCRLFFIYAFEGEYSWLYALRRYPGESPDQEGNDVRADLLKDCHLLFCEAIGGPAAARIIRHNIHPVKVTPGTSISSQREMLQTMLAGDLPPWLAKRLGKDNPLDNRVF